MYLPKLFNGSKLTLRFFIIFLIYSMAVIVIMIITASIVTSREAPPLERGNPHFMKFEKHDLKMAEEKVYRFLDKHGSLRDIKEKPELFEKDFFHEEKNHIKKFVFDRINIVDMKGSLIIGKDKIPETPFVAILKDAGEPVGKIFLSKPYKLPLPLNNLFREIGTTLLIVALIAAIISFFIASLLAKYFLFPVSQLADAVKRFSKYDFDSRINFNRKDEIGMLARDFNDMADRLDKYEKMRKQWIADIAHELRTPISIMQAEIEAVQDSVWPLSMKTMDHLHSEISYLAKTVNDLHLLSVAESKGLTLSLEEISVYSIINDAAERFKEKFKAAGVVFESEPDKYSNIFVLADSYLLRTVINNIMENTVRYTDNPGKLLVTCHKENSMAVILFDDTPPAVPENYIDRIFDRLFRVDASRSRKHGGSGLGLSTCKTHIEALNGTVTAAKSPLGGLRIIIKIPLYTGDTHDKRKDINS